MLFSMVAIGSTGDVRPYILLGRELQRRGHQTRLIAFAPFEEARARWAWIFCRCRAACTTIWKA